MTWTTPPREGRDDRAAVDAPAGAVQVPRTVATDQERHAGRPGRRGPLGWAVDRHGLTATGAVLLVLVVGLAGGAVDKTTGNGLRLLFDACFIGSCALAALLVHRDGLRAVATLPPLAYCVVVLLADLVSAYQRRGSLLRGQAVALLDALVLGAPVLFLATGVTLLIVLVRALAGRRRRR